MGNITWPGSGWIHSALLRTFADHGTNAHRLCTTADGWVERLGSDVLICFKSDLAREAFSRELDEWSAASGFHPERVFAKFLPRQNAERISPTLLSGDAEAPKIGLVQENGVRYAIDFEAGYSAGLFLDQRNNRAFLRARRPRQLLNTFAYTCSFSVVAALEGAATVSLDLSRKSLSRGEENFRLNGVDPTSHTFRADDVLEVLPRLVRRQEAFDAIILDPPTFSRGAKGRRFQVEQDFEALLTLALQLAAPKAAILLSTNCTRLERTTLEAIARHGMKLNRRHGTFHREPPLPDLPAEAAARTVWLLLSQ